MSGERRGSQASRRDRAASPDRLLLFRLSALGDVIHTLPAVVALREAMRETKIEWVVESAYRELVESVARVPAIAVRMKAWGRKPLASRGAMAQTRKSMRGAAATVDFQGLIKSAALARLSGAPLRFGFGRETIREKPALLFTNRRIDVDSTLHVIDQNLQLAGGVAAAFGRDFGGLPRGLETDFERFAADPDGKLGALSGAVVVLPGAGRGEKLWPPERFAELARRMARPVVALWGPGEEELAARTDVPLAPPTSLRELAWVLRHAQLVIGGDTGPLHLASALGTPVIGLYGPTDPRRNGPYGQLDRCVDHFRSARTMESITVDEVMEQVGRVSG